VSLEVVSSVQYLDLARREADLALRFAAPTGRDLVSLAEAETGIGAFGSAGYAARLSKSPKLADVAWIAWAPPLDHLSPNPELAKLIPGFAPAFASDDYLVQLRAAERGLGAMLLGRMKHRFSGEPSLVELPIDLGPRKATLHLVAARSALEIPRVRAIAELLAREVSRAKDPVKKRRLRRCRSRQDEVGTTNDERRTAPKGDPPPGCRTSTLTTLRPATGSAVESDDNPRAHSRTQREND
jgi:DNA-binding transcriptional LysR family regulator